MEKKVMLRIFKRIIFYPLFLMVLIWALVSGCEEKQEPTASKPQSFPQAQEEETGTDRELVVVSYGGAYQEAQRKAFFEPFAKKYDVKVREETWSGDLSELKAMVDSGNTLWDVVAVEAHMVIQGAAENLYETIDSPQLPRDELLPEAIHEYGVATVFWSTIIAYNTDSFPSSKPHPVGWKEFWDVEKFPGPRGLRKDPVGNLEFALLASGAPKEKLYPLDVDKAFESLDKIKDKITLWWEDGEQPAQLLGSGEVLLSSAWNGRIFDAAKNGKPEAIEWEGGIVNSDWWVIPRGSKNKDLARLFVAFASSAEPQANYPKYIPYGPVNKEALGKLPAEIFKDLPTSPENLEKQFIINNHWWHENKAQVLERWNKWLLQ